MTYFTEEDYEEACDNAATLLAELQEARALLEKALARVDELELYIERDKDGDGFISKDAMDMLFPCEIEGD